MRGPVYKLCALVVAGLAGGESWAGLIVDTSGGNLVFSAGADDLAEQRPLSEDYFLFDEPFATVDVSVNGNLNFGGNGNFENSPFPAPFVDGMIAPLWDDFFVPAGSSVTDLEGDGWYAATWNGVSSFRDTNLRLSFQALLFARDQEIGGFQFRARDIAFAYGRLDGLNDDSATVGLNGFNGTDFAGLPGSAGSLVDPDHLYRLPVDPRWFLLYRWNGDGYDVSYQRVRFVTPEPGPLMTLGLGGLALLGWRRRRR